MPAVSRDDAANSLEARAMSRNRWSAFVDRVGTHNISLLIALAILLVIFGTLRSDVFFSSRNIVNIGLAITILGILAMSQTVVIVAGGLDISVGSMVGLTTVSTAMAIQGADRPSPASSPVWRSAPWPDSSTA